MDVIKAGLIKVVPWQCPLCAHMNVGNVDVCQNVVKCGGKQVCTIALPVVDVENVLFGSHRYGQNASSLSRLKSR